MYTKPSKNIVQQKIHDKIFNESFKMIVKEAYLHSLVYDINQAEEGSLEALMQYSDACCDHLGCKNLLESAIASQPTGPKKTFLMDIYKVCESTATEISTRATEGSKSTDQFDDVPLEELVRTAGFTKGEFKKFQNKVDSLGMDEIGGIIQNKVRDVLKQEHDDQVRIDTINKELTDVVNQNNKEREEAKADMQPDDLDNGQFDENEDLDEIGEADKTDDEAPTDDTSDDSEDKSGKDSKAEKSSKGEDDSDEEMPEEPEGDELNPDSKGKKSDKKDSESEDEEDESKDKSKKDKKSDDGSDKDTSESDDKDDGKDKKDKEEALKESFLRAMGIDNIDHKSYFNTLQVAALENILWTCDPAYVNPDKINTARLINLTLEAGLMPFRAERSAMESLQLLNMIKSPEVRDKARIFKNSIMDGATTDAITVYTMMECFHTLNLIPLKYSDIRTATESVQPMSLKITKSKRLANNYLRQLSIRAAKESVSVNSIPAANKLLNELEATSNILHHCTESVMVNDSALNSIDKSIENVRKKLTAMESATTPEKKVDSFVMNQKKNISIAQCNKIASMVKSVGSLAEAVVFEGTENPNSYDVTIKRANGIDAHTYVTMESLTGDLDSELKNFIMESNLGKKDMPQISLKKNDGKGTTEVLKY